MEEKFYSFIFFFFASLTPLCVQVLSNVKKKWKSYYGPRYYLLPNTTPWNCLRFFPSILFSSLVFGFLFNFFLFLQHYDYLCENLFPSIFFLFHICVCFSVKRCSCNQMINWKIFVSEQQIRILFGKLDKSLSFKKKNLLSWMNKMRKVSEFFFFWSMEYGNRWK